MIHHQESRIFAKSITLCVSYTFQMIHSYMEHLERTKHQHAVTEPSDAGTGTSTITSARTRWDDPTAPVFFSLHTVFVHSKFNTVTVFGCTHIICQSYIELMENWRPHSRSSSLCNILSVLFNQSHCSHHNTPNTFLTLGRYNFWHAREMFFLIWINRKYWLLDQYIKT